MSWKIFFIPWKRGWNGLQWESFNCEIAQVFSYLGHFIVNLHLNFLYIFDLNFSKKKLQFKLEKSENLENILHSVAIILKYESAFAIYLSNGMLILKIRRKILQTNLKIVHCWCNNVKCQSWENCCLWFVEWMSACSRVYNWIFSFLDTIFFLIAWSTFLQSILYSLVFAL